VIAKVPKLFDVILLVFQDSIYQGGNRNWEINYKKSILLIQILNIFFYYCCIKPKLGIISPPTLLQFYHVRWLLVFLNIALVAN